MTVLRRDGLTGDWVIVAPARAGRPRERAREHGPAPCPFCPGRESMLPEVLAEWPSASAPGWSVRVVPNRYPVVTPEPASGLEGRPALGRHEVIVESPDHRATLASLPAAHVETVLTACRDRLRRLERLPGIRTVVLFRNQGRCAGASLRHPHSQIVALGIVPPLQEAMAAHAAAHLAATGRCPVCDEIAGLRAAPARAIEESEHFMAAVPFGARVPGEAWLMPKRHGPGLGRAGDDEVRDLAALLGRVLRRLRAAFEDPPWNYVFDQAPTASSDHPASHWKLRLAPVLGRPAGLELGTGLAVNTSEPEADAARYRAAAV